MPIISCVIFVISGTPIISCVIFVVSETPGSHYCQTSSQDLPLSRQQVLQRGEDHLLFNVLDIDNKPIIPTS